MTLDVFVATDLQTPKVLFQRDNASRSNKKWFSQFGVKEPNTFGDGLDPQAFVPNVTGDVINALVANYFQNLEERMLVLQNINASSVLNNYISPRV